LNYSEFPLGRELHRYKTIGAALFEERRNKHNELGSAAFDVSIDKLKENFSKLLLSS
jgi:hypothetical protein